MSMNRVEGTQGIKKMNRSKIGNGVKNQAGGKYGFNTKSKLVYMPVLKISSPSKGSKLAVTIDNINNMATTSGANKKSLMDNATQNVTPNPFKPLNMVDNDVGVASSGTFISKINMVDVNVGKNKVVNMDDEDNDNDFIEDDNETAHFMNPKYLKNMSTSLDGGGRGKSSLYEQWKESYEDNLYDDDDYVRTCKALSHIARTMKLLSLFNVFSPVTNKLIKSLKRA
ncbi:hypothetical protein Tco_1571722 [Tanacetum coccineum]